MVLVVVSALGGEPRPTPATWASVGHLRFPWTSVSDTSALEATPPRAGWIVRENLRPGTRDWRIPTGTTGTIEGYANKVSVQQGDGLTLFVSTPAARFRVLAYRMGWYQGD